MAGVDDDGRKDTAVPEVLSTHLVQRVASYIEASHGREIGFVVAGRREPARRISLDVVPFKPQRGGYGSFSARPDAVREAVQRVVAAGHHVMGVAHLHPGHGAAAAYHSTVDEEEIEGRLLPMLAAGALETRVSAQAVRMHDRGTHAEGRVDPAGRLVIRMPTPAPDFIGVEATSKHATMSSLVFSRDLYVYCLQMHFSFAPSFAGPIKQVQRVETGIAVEHDADLGFDPPPLASGGAVQAEVDEEILTEPAYLVASSGPSTVGTA